MNCKNCNDYLGKQIEVESNQGNGNGFPKGKKIKVYCSNCGEEFDHITQYNSIIED